METQTTVMSVERLLASVTLLKEGHKQYPGKQQKEYLG